MPFDIYGLEKDKQYSKLESIAREAIDHPIRRNWLAEADLSYQFCQGEQWTAEDKKVLKERNQPEVTYDELSPAVERIIGQYRRQNLTNTLVGRNMPVDEETANNLSEMIRFVDQDTEYLFEEKEAIRDMLKGGFGVLECGVETDTLGKPRIFIDWEDPFHVFPDPYCRRYDWNHPRGGARYILRSKWMNLEEGQSRWPKYADKLEDALSSYHPTKNVSGGGLDPKVLFTTTDHFFDRERRLIRPVEIWFKQRQKEEVVVTPYGLVGDEYPEKLKRQALKLIPKSYKRLMERDRMYTAVICGDMLIQEAQPSPYRCAMFPFIPFYCLRKKDGQPRGWVWRAIDPNREINARRSRALYMLNARQTIYEKNAIRSKNELADELARSDGQIEIENGKFDKFMIHENQDIGQANLQMLQESKTELQHLLGEDYLAPQSEMRSGKGAQQQQLPYHLSQVDLMDNIKRSKRMKTLLVIAYIQQYYDVDMVFEITDDEGKAKTITVSAAQFQAIKQRTFDVVIKETIDYATLQEEQFDTISTVLPQLVQGGPGWGKVLLAMSSIRDKEKIMKMMEDIEKAPPSMPKISVSVNFSELDKQEKAAIAQLAGLPDLAQYEMQQGRGPMRDDLIEADLTKTQIREGVRSGIEMSRLQAKGQADLANAQLKLREMNDAREQAAIQQQLDQQAAQSESASGTTEG